MCCEKHPWSYRCIMCQVHSSAFTLDSPASTTSSILVATSVKTVLHVLHSEIERLLKSCVLLFADAPLGDACADTLTCPSSKQGMYKQCLHVRDCKPFCETRHKKQETSTFHLLVST